MNRIFTSSLVWNVRPAMLIHARASTPPPPCTLTPKKIVYSIRKNENPASSSQNEAMPS